MSRSCSSSSRARPTEATGRRLDSSACCAIGNSIAWCAGLVYDAAGMSFVLTCPHCGVREVADFAFGGEVTARPRQHPVVPRAVRVQLLPPQRRRGTARVVVSPLRVPHVVPGRARHPHERGPADRRFPGSSVQRRERLAPTGRVSGSTAIRRSRSRSTASASRRSPATRSARRCTRPARARSRGASSTTGAAD